jgi:hypothetical protein
MVFFAEDLQIVNGRAHVALAVCCDSFKRLKLGFDMLKQTNLLQQRDDEGNADFLEANQ